MYQKVNQNITDVEKAEFAKASEKYEQTMKEIKKNINALLQY